MTVAKPEDAKPTAATGKAVAVASKLQTALKGVDAMEGTLKQSLPSDMSVDKFSNVVKTALNLNPALLDADRQSFYNACVLAAQDGLLPDGREGALVVFGGKVQWMRMIGGLRKKAAQHDFDLIAYVIHANDKFEYQLGDEEKIVHIPTPLGEPAGDFSGAYAIATNLKTGKKYRDVMDKAAIDKVRAVSRASSGGPWATWYEEQAKKTVARRLFKQLPFYTEDDVQKIIERENAEFDLSGLPVADAAPVKAEPQVTGTRARDKVLGAGAPTTQDPPLTVQPQPGNAPAEAAAQPEII